MRSTTNYSLPLYEAGDVANLTGGYNTSMNIIDTTMNGIGNNMHKTTLLFSPGNTPTTGNVGLSDYVTNYDALIITALAADGVQFDTQYVHNPNGKTVDLNEMFTTTGGLTRSKRLRYSISGNTLTSIVNESYIGTVVDPDNINQCGYVLGIKYSTQ